MAMIPSHYEINVALNGTHFFATDMRSIQNLSTLNEILGVFKEKFPKTEGYSITVTQIICTGIEQKNII